MNSGLVLLGCFMTNWLRIVLVIAVASLAACGGSSTAAPTPTQANITVTPSPNPAASTVCAPNPCRLLDGTLVRWFVQGTLTIQETAGIGGNVDSITVAVTTPLVYSPADIVQGSGTNHMSARGTLIFPLTWRYGFVSNPNAVRQIVLPYIVQFTDDRGNHLTVNAQWSVN